MSNENQVPTWPLITGIAVIVVGVIFMIFRANFMLSLVFVVLGVSLILAWYVLYSRQRQNYLLNYGQNCVCPICKHVKPPVCIQEKCACCVIMDQDKIIGHSNTPLQ